MRRTPDARYRYKLPLTGPEDERRDLVIEWDVPLRGSKAQGKLIASNYLRTLALDKQPVSRLRVDREGCVSELSDDLQGVRA